MNERHVSMDARERGPYYLAGPMTGIPQFNFPLFFAVTEKLRGLGYEIISPAELDDEEDEGAAMSSPDGAVGSGTGSTVNKTWGDFLMRDVKLIADTCKGIIFLPGWQQSRGARLEAFVAILCGHEFFECKFDEVGDIDDLEGVDPEYVLVEIYNATK